MKSYNYHLSGYFIKNKGCSYSLTAFNIKHTVYVIAYFNISHMNNKHFGALQEMINKNLLSISLYN